MSNKRFVKDKGNDNGKTKTKRQPLKKRKKVDPTHVQIIRFLSLTFQDRLYGPCDEANMVSVTVDEKYYTDDTMNDLDKNLNTLTSSSNSSIFTKTVIEKEKESVITINVFYGESEDHVNTIVKDHFSLTEEEMNKNPIIIN